MEQREAQSTHFKEGESFTIFSPHEELSWDIDKDDYKAYEKEFFVGNRRLYFCLNNNQYPSTNKLLLITNQGPVIIKPSDPTYDQIFSKTTLGRFSLKYDVPKKKTELLSVEIEGPKVSILNTETESQFEDPYGSTSLEWIDKNTDEVHDEVFMPLDAAVLSRLRFTLVTRNIKAKPIPA